MTLPDTLALDHTFAACPRTGERIGDCLCPVCTLAYGRLIENMDALPSEADMQAAERLTDTLLGRVIAADALVETEAVHE